MNTKWLKILVSGLCFASATEVLAFKIGTHVWVAQEVINNLEKCSQEHGRSCMTVMMNDRPTVLPVPSEVATAIKEYPEYYRNGHIGPDSYPDVLVGQTVIHAGITSENSDKSLKSTGFGTSHWLSLLLKRAEAITDTEQRKKALAFVYGFMGHAATDVFAHTYVNMYAGDIFSIADGENDVESRHVALEDYIQKSTPDLVDAKGNRLPPAYKTLMRGKELGIPADFVRDQLMFDSEAAQELKKVDTALHLTLVRNLRDELVRSLKEKKPNMSNVEYAKQIAKQYWNQYNPTETNDKTIENFFKFASGKSGQSDGESGTVQDLEIIAIQILAYYYMDLDLTSQQAAKTAELMNWFQDIQGDAIGDLAKLQTKIDENLLKMFDYGSKAQIKGLDAAFKETYKAFSETMKYYNGLKKYRDQVKNQVDEIDRSIRKVAKNSCKVIPESQCKHEVSTTVSIPYPCKKTECRRPHKWAPRVCVDVPDTCYREDVQIKLVPIPGCQEERKSCIAWHKEADEFVKQANKERDKGIKYIDQTNEQMLQASKNAIQLFKSLKHLAELNNDAIQRLWKSKMALESNIAAVVVNISKSHRARLNEWVEDIDEAMKQFAIANGQAMRNTMDDDPSTGFMDPLSYWHTCYMPSIMGIAQEALTVSTCLASDVKAQYDKLAKDLENEVRKIDPKIAGRILKARDQVIESAPFVIAKAINEPFKKVTGSSKYDFVKLLHVATSKVSRQELNEIFNRDGSGKHLLKFGMSQGNISDRVDVDMHLVNGKFDPDHFAPIKNAVTLASLTLLSEEGLGQLGNSPQLDSIGFGSSLDNILSKALRSIDGNHQWMQLAPP